MPGTWQPTARGERYVDGVTGRILGTVEDSLVCAEWYASIRGHGSLGEYDTRLNAKRAVEDWITIQEGKAK